MCIDFVKKEKNKSCNKVLVLVLYMHKYRQDKFIKILWEHTDYTGYMYDFRTFSSLLTFDIKNSLYKLLMANSNENIFLKLILHIPGKSLSF